jgi:hypothetical protein
MRVVSIAGGRPPSAQSTWRVRGADRHWARREVAAPTVRTSMTWTRKLVALDPDSVQQQPRCRSWRLIRGACVWRPEMTGVFHHEDTADRSRANRPAADGIANRADDRSGLGSNADVSPSGRT